VSLVVQLKARQRARIRKAAADSHHHKPEGFDEKKAAMAAALCLREQPKASKAPGDSVAISE